MPLHQTGPLELYIRTEDGRYVTASVSDANVELEANVDECIYRGESYPISTGYTMSFTGRIEKCTVVDAILQQTSASLDEEVIALLDEHVEASND